MLSVVYNTEGFSRWERGWLRWLLSDFDLEEVYDPELNVIRERMLLVVGGDLRGQDSRISKHLQDCKQNGARVGVIHLSDEWCASPVNFYADAAFVFRTYWRDGAIDGKHTRYLPLGYSDGMQASPTSAPKPISERKNTWCFAGEAKHTRNRMIAAARRITGGNEHLTRKWEDEAALGREGYAEMLSNSVFALCPIGNLSPDTFRIYEALEAGAIPIVEDWGGVDIWRDIVSPAGLLRIKPWREQRWRTCIHKMRTKSYWLTCFGTEFPCPRLRFWENLEATVKSVLVEETSRKIRAWWTRCKESYRNELGEAIRSTLDISSTAPLTRSATDGVT